MSDPGMRFFIGHEPCAMWLESVVVEDYIPVPLPGENANAPRHRRFPLPAFAPGLRAIAKAILDLADDTEKMRAGEMPSEFTLKDIEWDEYPLANKVT